MATSSRGGYEPEEVVGKANSSILHVPQDVEAGRHKEIMEIALREGKWEGTLQRVRKNGEHFTARMVITPRRDAFGQAVGFLLISKDITSEIRLTEQLQATQFYTRSLIESSIDALMTTDPVGVITDLNQQMETLTGYARDELIGSPSRRACRRSSSSSRRTTVRSLKRRPTRNSPSPRTGPLPT